MTFTIHSFRGYRGNTHYEVEVDSTTRLLYHVNRDGPGIALKFRVNSDDQWHYQSLMWCCRAGRRSYYPALVTLYRHLRRNKVTDHSLHYLAWGDMRGRNGGYAIGTVSYCRLQEARMRYAKEKETGVLCVGAT